jgi:hypothetical protein
MPGYQGVESSPEKELHDYGAVDGSGSSKLPPPSPQTTSYMSSRGYFWRRNFWYYFTVFSIAVIVIVIIARVGFLIASHQSLRNEADLMRASTQTEESFNGSDVSGGPRNPHCRLCDFEECEKDECPRQQISCKSPSASQTR